LVKKTHSMKKSKIIFDAERMKYPHTGLYHFCLNLGNAIVDQCPKDKELFFYLNAKMPKIFGPDRQYIDQYSLQKFFMPRLRNFSIWHSTFQLTSYLPRHKSLKVVSTIHDLNFLKEGKSPQKIEGYLKKIQHTLDRADEIVAISNYVKRDLEDYCDLKGKEVSVIYNGNNIDPNLLQNLLTGSSPLDQDYIFTIGTVNRKKNFHVLPYLLVGNDLKLIISGIVHEPDYHKKIQDIAAKLNVADRVVLTGPVTEAEKYNYLKNCALFVFPSIAEGFGLPVIEAMSFGKKVLLSKHTSLPEIGGKEAFYMESMEPDDLMDFGKNKLMELINFPSKEKEIKQWASQFTWQNAALQYWDIYNRLLK